MFVAGYNSYLLLAVNISCMTFLSCMIAWILLLIFKRQNLVEELSSNKLYSINLSYSLLPQLYWVTSTLVWSSGRIPTSFWHPMWGSVCSKRVHRGQQAIGLNCWIKRVQGKDYLEFWLLRILVNGVCMIPTEVGSLNFVIVFCWGSTNVDIAHRQSKQFASDDWDRTYDWPAAKILEGAVPKIRIHRCCWPQ